MICMVSGLVLTSPFVFYQVWAFIAAGLYRHERHYVKKFLPFSLGLFLSGVFLCFFGVLPYTLMFLLQFNVWLGIEPTMRITDWMSFATILPVVFGVCFQTPLVMLFLERIGILTGDDFRSKRKIAILVMVIAAAILTPGPDVFSQLALAVPMVGLYELGLILIESNKKKAPAHVDVVRPGRAGAIGRWARSGGMVYLVGAGPGDPGLLTLRGREALARAEVVVYDHLASPRLLDLAPPGALRISAGKTIGHCTLSQDRDQRRPGRARPARPAGRPAQGGRPVRLRPGGRGGRAPPGLAGSRSGSSRG